MLEPIVKPVSEMTRDDVLHNLRVVLEMMEDGRIKDEEFNMGNACGTACCIGGWVCAVTRDRDASIVDLIEIVDGDDQTGPLDAMFFDWSPPGLRTDQIRTRHAIPVIRHYLETGVTDWTLAKEVA